MTTLADRLAEYRRRGEEAARVGATAPVAAIYEAVVAELSPLCGNGKAPAPVEAERLLTPAEAAARLRVSRRFVYAHREQLGGRVLSKRALRFPEAALLRYLARRP
jgi:helix-turn-helix protein